MTNADEFEERLADLAEKKRMDAPGKTLHEQQRAAALARLGGTTMPADPAKKATWAHDMAVKNGWLETRVPGEEG